MMEFISQIGFEGEQLEPCSAKLVRFIEMDSYSLLLFEDTTGRKVFSYKDEGIKLKENAVYKFDSQTKRVLYKQKYPRFYSSASHLKELKIDSETYTFDKQFKKEFCSTHKRNLVHPELLLTITKVESFDNPDGSSRKALVLKDQANNTYYYTAFDSLNIFNELIQHTSLLFENYSYTTELDKSYSKITAVPFSNLVIS